MASPRSVTGTVSCALHELAHVDLLGAQHVFVHRARQWQGLGLLGALPARVSNPGGRCAEADEGAAAEVRDQEADRARADQGGEFVGDHVDGVGRGNGFDPLEQPAKIGSETAIAHVLNHRVSPRALPRARRQPNSSLCGRLPAKALIRGRATVLGTQKARTPVVPSRAHKEGGPAVGRAPLEG